MKVSRYHVGTHKVEGETRPVFYLQYSNGDSRFVFERDIKCERCENGIVPGCDESYPCTCNCGVRTLDIDCDAIGNEEGTDLYLPPITTRVDLKALELIYTGKVEVL